MAFGTGVIVFDSKSTRLVGTLLPPDWPCWMTFVRQLSVSRKSMTPVTFPHHLSPFGQPLWGFVQIDARLGERRTGRVTVNGAETGTRQLCRKPRLEEGDHRSDGARRRGAPGLRGLRKNEPVPGGFFNRALVSKKCLISGKSVVEESGSNQMRLPGDHASRRNFASISQSPFPVRQVSV